MFCVVESPTVVAYTSTVDVMVAAWASELVRLGMKPQRISSKAPAIAGQRHEGCKGICAGKLTVASD